MKAQDLKVGDVVMLDGKDHKLIRKVVEHWAFDLNGKHPSEYKLTFLDSQARPQIIRASTEVHFTII